jgi:glucosylceramidase
MKIAGAGLAGVAAATRADAITRDSRAPQGAIQVWRTAGDQRFAQAAPLEWRTAGAVDGAVRLDPGLAYQEILGFGASFTDSACIVINRLPPDARQRLLRELFDPTQSAFNVARLCIGASDYAATPYSFDEGEPDPDLARFSIDHDRDCIIPTVLQGRQLNPDLFLLASPWSPPGWMKANNSLLGGSMRKRYFAPYAQYFLKFLKGYAAAGVVVDAVTVQNEVDTDQDGRMPACLWGQEYEIEFVARHLGPQFAAAGLATKIWILDHNYNLWGRVRGTLGEPSAAKYVDGVAWHGYAGTADMMTRVHDEHPDKHMYWTEGGPGYTDPAYLTDWVRWSSTFSDILRNWARCVIGWNLALDEKGRPNIGPFNCGGIVTIDSATGVVLRSGMYWALVHHSRLIKRGARRIGSDGGPSGLAHVAFANPDGSFAAVLTNAGAERTVRLDMAGRVADVPLAEGSITSLAWR